MRFVSRAGIAALACVSGAAAAMTADADTVAAITADPVIAAERAFAARGQEVSVKEAFQEYSADDGIALTADGVRNVKEFIGSWPDVANAGFIMWGPSMAGIAQSGDLGFTTGPASFNKGARFSQYFTVWKKQADGGWKWLMDQGSTPHAVKSEAAQDVFVVPVSTAAPMEPGAALADLQSAEAVLAGMAATDAAVAERYAAEVRLIGYQPLPVNGLEAARSILAGRAADLRTQHQGGGVSDAGDLGYTYGVATWTQGEKAMRGPYLRVWQRRADGWKVLVENVNPF